MYRIQFAPEFLRFWISGYQDKTFNFEHSNLCHHLLLKGLFFFFFFFKESVSSSQCSWFSGGERSFH
jgi:hypothetical protein